MSNDNNQGIGASEALSKTASIANTIRGAVKTGKAIAGLAKGAAVGGPYGAIAMSLWQNRKLIVKIIIAAAFLIMLPILFIVMLPSLVFGDINDASIMNDNAAIYMNIEDINSRVKEVIDEAHSELLKKIDGEINKQPKGSNNEIVDEYDSKILFDSAIIISQYQVYKDNYKEVSVDDLILILKQHESKMFDYTVTSQKKDTDTTKATQKKKTEKSESETTYTYTVTFVGIDSFADSVFHLTPKEKAYSEDLANNLALFLNGYDNNGNSPNATGPYTGGVLNAPIVDWQNHISSGYGYRIDPVTGASGAFHDGIDIGVPLGTPIYAAEDGLVSFSGDNANGYGKHIVIEHNNGLQTLYGHCSQLLVRNGAKVKRGEMIAKVGSTGKSTGNHLHFRVWLNGNSQNPLNYLKGGS